MAFVGHTQRILKTSFQSRFDILCVFKCKGHLNTQEYRSGHNEAVLKTVRPKATGVRIPLPAPKTKAQPRVGLLFLTLVREDSHPPLYCVAMQMGCGREPKAILLARVAVAKRIAIRQCIPDNIHSKAILFLLSTPSVTLRVPPPSLMEAMFAFLVLQNSRGEIPLPAEK